MVPSESHPSVIEIGIVEVAGLAAPLTHEGGWIPAAGVGKVLGMVIAELELAALGEALVDGDGERFVVASAAILHVYQRIPDRVRRVGTRRGKSNGIRRHLVWIGGYREIVAVAAVVGDAQAGLKAEITLDGEVPLLDVRIFIVERVGQIEVLGARLSEIRWEW